MKTIAIAIHGGAGPDSEQVREHRQAYYNSLKEVITSAYLILDSGRPAEEAVEQAIMQLENNPLFNAGKGSALNEKGEVEMCASMMHGKNGEAGAAAIIRKVKNPIRLARAIMENSHHTYLGSAGALEFASSVGLPLEEESYFITAYQQEQFEKSRAERKRDAVSKKNGTVGAVALDIHGNLVAGTSTGGLEFCAEGRIADSSMIGAGTYANNKVCAVSTTGTGELHMKHVSAFHIAALIEYKGLSLEEAAKFLIHEKCKQEEGDLGLIGVDPCGNLTAVFNTERMHRALLSSKTELYVGVYPGD